MKNIIFIICILIIFFKTGNVLSNNNTFDVNNIEISKETSKNKEKLVFKAFEKAFKQLTNRLLLKEDIKKLSDIDLNQIKKLVSYYQIINPDKKKNQNIDHIKVNIFFDKDRLHNFFYKRNILYSDIANREVILFPLLKKNDKYFFYSRNYFYQNWNNENFDNLIQYTLPLENIENIEEINLNINNIYNLDILNFFKEYENSNIVFLIIEIKEKIADIFLISNIEGKKIKKTLSINRIQNTDEEKFYNNIINEINNLIGDLIKSQNLIDVRTPSFLNAKIKISDINNLVEFNKRLKKIDLIDDFYVQKLNKDYVLIKIKYLGKINKIISLLKNQNLELNMNKGKWQISII